MEQEQIRVRVRVRVRVRIYVLHGPMEEEQIREHVDRDAHEDRRKQGREERKSARASSFICSNPQSHYPLKFFGSTLSLCPHL